MPLRSGYSPDHLQELRTVSSRTQRSYPPVFVKEAIAGMGRRSGGTRDEKGRGGEDKNRRRVRYLAYGHGQGWAASTRSYSAKGIDKMSRNQWGSGLVYG